MDFQMMPTLKQTGLNVVFAVPAQFVNKQGLVRLMMENGIAPGFATSIVELGDLLRQAEPAVVFVDSLFAPDLLGLLRNVRSTRKTRVVLLSDQLSTDERRSLQAVGVDQILTRPVHPSVMLKIVGELTGYQKALPPTVPLAAPPPKRVTRPDSSLTLVKQQWIAQYRRLAPSLELIDDELSNYDLVARKIEGASPLPSPVWSALESIAKTSQLPAKQLVAEVEQALESTTRALGATRSVVVSLKPHALWPTSECPVQLFALASSDRGYPWKSKALPSVLMPLVPVAFRRREPVLLTQSTPYIAAGVSRPSDWLCKGKMEAASAVVPLVNAGSMFAAVVIQYSKFDSDGLPALADSVGQFGRVAPLLCRLDFLSRIYREMDAEKEQADGQF